MVKTRHGGAPDEANYASFLSLSPRRTRRMPTYVEDKNKEVRKMHLRSSRSRNISSDEFEESVRTPARFRSRRRQQIIHQAEESLSADDTVFKHNDTNYQHIRRSSRRPVFRNEDNPYAKPRYDASSPPRAIRSSRSLESVHQAPSEIPVELLNGDGDGEAEGTRRSTRQKKVMYNTYNMTVIDKQLTMLDGIQDEERAAAKLQRAAAKLEPYRKRRKVDVEPVHNDETNGDVKQDKKMVDMYTRVKRERRCVKRNMYGAAVDENEEKSTEEEEEEKENEETESSSSSEEEEEEPQAAGKYFLREHKPRTALYEAPAIEPVRRPRSIFRERSPPRRSKPPTASYNSPARRKRNYKKTYRKRAFHGNSSTSSSSSSSDGDSGDDEKRFEKRKSKSMARSRQRCLPMNLEKEDIAHGVLRDRQRVGSSLADVDPMNVDKSVTFEQVGGLGKHVRSLKEMILFPLMYPEVFEKFKIAPPRGVLFHGPPGTGKTLIARALANECSIGNKKVSFFMRKGADCLSKWVGESERQLRLLFDQAFQLRPSIIFFDEIDGLAPVRSSRQDQIHSSIVSTLLALMDGLDSRGEVVIIGATNRIDSIDPALRRPGRFDREFLFPLPSKEARQQILSIHTSAWNPKLSEPFLCELAEQCVGYCGADLKSLCTEAALHALRRRYPQIYNSQDKLQLDLSKIHISARDFHHGMQSIVPASQRAVASPGRSLSNAIRPLLQNIFEQTLQKLNRSFPSALTKLNSTDVPATSQEGENATNVDLDLYSDDEDDENWSDIYDKKGKSKATEATTGHFQFSYMSVCSPSTHRPRLLIEGEAGQGQSSHLAPALLYHLERIPVHMLDLPALFGISARTPEESCAQVFREARRTSPSIIYMPHINQWWDVITETLRATFLTLLYDMEPSAPILLLATSEERYTALPFEVRAIFDKQEVFVMRNPTFAERKEFFERLFLHRAIQPPSSKKAAAKRMLEVLPKAPAPPPRELTQAELKKLHQQEENTLRELRLFLRDTLTKLGRDRKFSIFAKPVDQEEVPDYYVVIEKPMDLSTMMSKIDLHKYSTVAEFLEDIDLICSNALEYNPDRDPQDRAIRHRACELRDASQALLNAELDPDFEKICHEIAESRKRRGESSSIAVPSYYYARPADKYQPGVRKELVDNTSNYPSRYSKRVRGMEVEEGQQETGAEAVAAQNQNEAEEEKPKYRIVVKKVYMKRAASKPGLSRSPWITKKRKYRKVYYYVDEHGHQFLAEDLNKGVNPGEDTSQDKTEGKNEESADEEENQEKKENDDGKEPKAEDDENMDCKSSEKVEENDEAKSTEKLTNGIISSDEEEEEEEEEVKKSRSLRETPSSRSRNVSPRATRSAGNSPGRAAVTSPSRQGTSPSRQPTARSPVTSHSPRASSSGTSPRTAGKTENGPVEKPQETVEESAQREESQESTAPTPTRRTRSKSQSEPDAMDVSPSTSTSAPDNVNATTSENTKGSDQADKDVVMESPRQNETETPQRITRSQIQTAQAKRANEILSEEAQDIVVDKTRLESLLTLTVEKTSGYQIERLERLHSALVQCVYMHRRDYDKNQMLNDMESTIETFSKTTS